MRSPRLSVEVIQTLPQERALLAVGACNGKRMRVKRDAGACWRIRSCTSGMVNRLCNRLGVAKGCSMIHVYRLRLLFLGSSWALGGRLQVS